MSEAFAACRNLAASAPVAAVPTTEPTRTEVAAQESGTSLFGHWAFRALGFSGTDLSRTAGRRRCPQASRQVRRSGWSTGGSHRAEQRTSVQYFRLWPEWFCASGSRVRDVVSHLRRDAGPGFESNGVNSYIGEGNFGCWVVALGSSDRSSTSTPRDAWARALIAQRPPATCSVWPET